MAFVTSDDLLILDCLFSHLIWSDVMILKKNYNTYQRIRDLSLRAHNLSIISVLKYSLMQYNDRYTIIKQSPLYIVISCHAVAIASCNKLHGLNGCLIILDLHSCNIISY